MSFAAGAGGALEPAELFVGVIGSAGVLWANPSQGLVPTPTPVYSGPLASFGPSVLVNLPNASALVPGPYWWFVIVDRDNNRVPDGDISDIVLTLISPD
jgi:hypothetical protein